jgi:hypothetical protein
MRTLLKRRLSMSPLNTPPVLTIKRCTRCGDRIVDEGTNFSCSCGVYFAYETVVGDLVRPEMPRE